MKTHELSGEPESLLLVAPAPVILREDGVELDVKFVEGMRLYGDLWGRPINCILFEGAKSIPFGRLYDRDELPFSLRVLPKGARVGQQDLEGYDVVFGSADSDTTLNLPDLCRDAGRRCVLAIEYTLRTRLDIIRLQRKAPHRKAYSALRTLVLEGRRRAAMRRADGIQANGYPAWNSYRALSDDGMLYLDNRMDVSFLATDAEMRAREQRLASAQPLRIIHSGRLETMKGAQDLVPVALALRNAGTAFEMEIYGTGDLKEIIAHAISEHGLGDCVRIGGAIDFETELVPHARAWADIFLSCHRQSDPSCTYIESMGCGLAIAGYDNAMLSNLVAESGAGWCVPMGQPKALAARITGLSKQRDDVSSRCRHALDFSRRHDFHSEFRRRIDHLRSNGSRGPTGVPV